MDRRGAPFVISGVSFLAFAVLGLAARGRPYFGWDLWLAHKIQQIGGLRPAMRLVSWPGYGWRGFGLTALMTLILWLTRHKWEALFAVGSAAISALLVVLVKALIGRSRPGASLVTVAHHLFDPSFPSGHVVFYCSLFGFIFGVAYSERRRAPRFTWVAMILTAIPILLVGISRIYLGAHWPSDVLGGYLLSAAWLPLVFVACRRAKERWPLDS